MRRHYALVVVAVVAWLAPGLASAEFIPPGKEATILGLFRPYGVDAPADQLGGGATLSEVAISQSTVTATVTAGTAKGRLILSARDDRPEGLTGDPDHKSASFALWLAEDTGPVKGGLDKLVAAVNQNDTGDFWSANTIAPEPEPQRPSKRSDAGASPPAEPERPLGAMAYIIVALLLGLLVACLPGLSPAIAGAGWKFWLALVLILVMGAGARYQMARNVPARKSAEVTIGCQEAKNCQDGNPCTRDLCEVGECLHIADKTLGPQCCLVDSDCPAETAPCVEAFCNLEINACGSRGACGDVAQTPEAPMGPAEVMPPSTLGTWFYTAAGVDTTNIPIAHGRSVGAAASTLGLLFLALFLVVAGAGRLTTLAALFLAALFPASLVAVGAGGAGSLVFALAMLALLGAAQAHASQPLGGQRFALALALFVAATAALALQRPEFALLPTLYLLSRPGGAKGRALVLGAVALALVVAAVQFYRLAALTETYAMTLTFAKRAEITLHALLITGQGVPFLLVLAAMVGLIVTPPSKRALPFLGLVAYLVAFAYSASLASDALHALRLTAPITILLAVPAGYGVEWIATRPSTYARLCVAILAVYFVLFPLVRRNALFALTVESEVTQPERQM
jgi:hypothetical protein